jgi:hypothetical protein
MCTQKNSSAKRSFFYCFILLYRVEYLIDGVIIYTQDERTSTLCDSLYFDNAWIGGYELEGVYVTDYTCL